MITVPDFISEYSLNGWRPLNIVVVGAGGTGSALLNKLFQLHMTMVNLGARGFKVTVYDDDTVSPSNIGRQAFWPCDLGANKANVLVERYNRFGDIAWQGVAGKFDGDVDRYGGTVIFGCVDNVDARKLIHGVMQKEEVVWIDCGNDSRSANVMMGVNAKTNGKKVYLPSIYDLFKTQMDDVNVQPEPSCSTAEAIARQEYGINDLAAGQAVQMLWQLIRHGKVDYQGVTVDLASGSTTPIQADPDIWAMFGYLASNKDAA
ncbi:PRTRC system ThiF family protein [Rheinheimera sp.]|uniref:PRTRC system ThiF family protein n=1 Tax=Rheinheimera sp. TaxID=1869214 RepID=UPI00404797F7